MEQKKNTRKLNVHGVLPIYKPKGVISKDVSRWILRTFGKVKLGHVGTLDPMAEGVLPILLGKSTRLQDYLLDSVKEYEFDIEFGYETSTMDAEGEIISRAEFSHVEKSEIDKVCSSLEGNYIQTPPMYSAIKYKGKPLYEYAREGRQDEVPLDILKKTVQIYSCICTKFENNVATIVVECSKGTYVRSVGQSIAKACESLATVTRLLRKQSAGLGLESCVDMSTLEENVESFSKYVIPMEKIVFDLPIWKAYDEMIVQKLKFGQKLQVDMRFFEQGFNNDSERRITINSIDKLMLHDLNGKLFGIGSATVLNNGLVELAMKRGL